MAVRAAFFEKVRVVVTWCELRQDYRHFRTDRIATLTVNDKRYPQGDALLKEWRERPTRASRCI